MLLLVCAILTLLSFVATRRFIDFALSRDILIDYPNSRSSHDRPVVRGAGIVFVCFSVCSWGILGVLTGSEQLLALCAGALPLAFVSFADDVQPLPVRLRLYVHVFAAALFLAVVPIPSVLWVHLGVLSYIWYLFALFFLVAVINLYNFMDGIDGMVSLQGVSVLAVWCLVSTWTGEYSFEHMMCAVSAASITGFLIHNWKPATVFMGDVGSTFIGYSIGCLAMIQTPGIMRTDNFFVLLILMLPVLFDATFTLIVRCIQGERWYKPHRRHLFQRLIRAGYSHTSVSTFYGAMTVFLGCVLLAVRYDFFFHPGIAMPFFLLPFLLLYVWVRYSEGQYDALEGAATQDVS